ncbi:MAG: hypothetical protein IJ724_00365 [Muribaculaceae bacterium]|nr:hypothetical protein [Muribaculaceae bacterium]MBR1725101.1 hypothetical protein [Muribaculaceae bacterium]
MKFNNKITIAVALAVVAIVLTLCLMMAGKIERKVVVEIDEVELYNRDSLHVGRGSDIHYGNVPHDYLTIIRDGNHFRWHVNDRYRDSLQYFKINDQNPNKHTIRNDRSQQIVLELPNSLDTSLTMTVTGEDVWRAWNKRFSEQKDVMVRHFATHYKLAQDQVSQRDSLAFLNQMQHHGVRSFFERNDDGIVLVILDRYTKIRDGNKEQGYERNGVTADSGEKAGHCKVQFFAVANHCYLTNSPESNTFQIDGVNHVMKASVKLTDWGAGHVMITAGDKNTLRLSYPKPITFVGTVDTLRAKAQQSSGIITLKQANNSFPNKSDLYLPTFCRAINFDLCNLEFYHEGDSVVVLRDNNFKTTVLSDRKSGFLPFSLIPAFNSIALQSGNAVLHARTGFIDQGFFMSYLWLPLLVSLVLLLVIWLPFSPFKLGDRTLANLSNATQAKTHRSYLSLLLGIALCYCVCKSLITLKLSYTYPYFEKLTGIMPIATSLMILLFFSLSVVLSAPLLLNRGSRGHLMSRWGAFLVCLVMWLALAFALFCVMDQDVSRGMLDSYFPAQVKTWRFWRWTSPDAVGINDTHRSVVYTLLAIEGVVLAVWAALNLCYKTLHKQVQLVARSWQSWAQKAQKFARDVIGKATSTEQYRKLTGVLNKCPIPAHRLLLAGGILVLFLLWAIVQSIWGAAPSLLMTVLVLAVVTLIAALPFVYDAFVGAVKALFPGHLLLIVLLALMGMWLGNFATAFITLGVILGVSRALLKSAQELGVEHSRPRHVVLLQMFFVIVAYTMGAMMGDNGYMTNFIGFFFCAIAVFFIVERYRSYEIGKEKKWVTGTTVVLVVAVMLMPRICSQLFNPEHVDYSRMSRRVMLYSNFEDLQRSGYRYSESDAEFMVIMSHYMQSDSIASRSHDPLSNDAHFMHQSVSAGQSPVAINDLSLPIAFFGSYGQLMTAIVYFGLLLLLLWLVLRHTLGGSKYFTRSMCWSLLAMLMWVGTSLYIYFSYIDWLPFTGRLNPGLGVDAVGEVLESALLLAFMGNLSAQQEEDN